MNTPTLTLAATLLFTSLLLPVAAQPGGRGDGEPLRAALADELLFGRLANGGQVTVDLDESGKIKLKFAEEKDVAVV